MEQFVFHTRRFTGQRALLLSWSIWAFCLLVMPVEPAFVGDFHGVALLAAANIALWMGLSISGLWDRSPDVNISDRLTQDSRDIDRIMLALVILGFAGRRRQDH